MTISFGSKYKKSHEESTHVHQGAYLSYSENISVDMRAVLSELKDDIRYATPGLVGIHIEQWLKMMDSPLFVDMLNHCFKYRHDIVFVFIVPFLDDGVLARVLAA
jgi:hypothetical protein